MTEYLALYVVYVQYRNIIISSRPLTLSGLALPACLPARRRGRERSAAHASLIEWHAISVWLGPYHGNHQYFGATTNAPLGVSGSK